MTGSGTTTLIVYAPDGLQTVHLKVDFDWWRDPGVRWHADASGTPPDSGHELIGYGEVDGDPLPEWLTDEMVADALDTVDLDFEND
jgi:hypothetical protein